MQTKISANIVAQPFSDLKAGEKFILVKDIQGGGWSPIYTKIMEGAQLTHPRLNPLAVQAVNSIGGMHHLKDDELVILVK